MSVIWPEHRGIQGIILSWLILLALCLFSFPAAGRAETPAPGIHWGAQGYPEQERTLLAGLTLNRFTEFNRSRERFNSSIRETIGLNFASLSWTERVQQWSTNLTIGAGPTSDQPTRFFQNDFVHNALLNEPPVPVGATREAFDFMIDGSLTRWGRLWDKVETAFLGAGLSSGSLYHEVYMRGGIRRASIFEIPFVRVSAMGRYGQLWHGAGFQQVSGQSYLAQASVSLGQYAHSPAPDWELEFGVTIDSGLFVDSKGNSIEKIFGTVAVRFPYGRFEVWNDALGRQDKGPTYGGTLMLDLLSTLQWF